MRDFILSLLYFLISGADYVISNDIALDYVIKGDQI